jgi:hypothetical protein
VGIDPESIWFERDQSYAASRSEVEAVLAKWQAEVFRPLWDQATPIKTSWYLSREMGLRAWGAHAAKARLKVHWREAYTLEDFRQFRLGESWGRDKGKIDDELASDLAAHLMEVDSAGFLEWANNVRRLKTVSLNPVQGRYCCLFDRAAIPLQYWTFAAAADYLCFEAKQQVREDLLRKWAERFALKIGKPSIVSGFTHAGIKGFNPNAAKTHGLPLPQSRNR